MSSVNQKTKFGKRRVLVSAGATLAAGVAAVLAVWVLGGSSTAQEVQPTAAVVRGPMVVSITEMGEVKAEQRKTIANELNWSVTIKEVAPEGRIVQKGDTIIRLECQELTDSITDQEITVQNMQDNYLTANKNAVVTKKTQDSRVRKAVQAVEDAKNDIKKYEEGDGPQKLREADSAIRLAESDVKLAEHKLQSKIRINEDPELNKPYSQNEIDAETLNFERLKLALVRAQTDKEMLEKYNHPRTLRDRQFAVLDADLTLECTRLEAETQIRLSEAAEVSAKMRQNKQEGRLKTFKQDAEKLHIVAAEPGLVVHETRRQPWNRPVTVAIGERIQPGQQLMIIPDMTTLSVETRVYEPMREQVKLGMPATIRLDAKRGRVLNGTVSKIAPLPDSQNPWLSPGVKVYPTMIKFNEEVTDLKPGMTAEVEIIINRLPDVLSVPIAAIFVDGEATFCWRAWANKPPERVAVTVGATNETHAQVLTGLCQGDLVLLAPPSGSADGGKFKSLGKKETATQSTSQSAAEAASQPTSRPTDDDDDDKNGNGETVAA